MSKDYNPYWHNQGGAGSGGKQVQGCEIQGDGLWPLITIEPLICPMDKAFQIPNGF
jgi:hypothetical protein